jgi:hypothetical protein
MIRIDAASFFLRLKWINNQKTDFLREIKRDFGGNPFFHWIFEYLRRSL